MKLAVKVVLSVICVLAICFSVYIISMNQLAKHNTKIAQVVMNSVAVQIVNEVKAKGEIVIAVKDKDGNDVKVTLVEKPLEVKK